jgi:hypothetical protein
MGLAPILPVLLRLLVYDWYYMEFTAWAMLPYLQYYSFYWFTTGTAWSLLHGPHSHTSSTSLSTGLRLVLRGVYCMGLTPVPPVLLHLLVYVWYYVEFTAWASLPYLKYNSVYWFTTGIHASLLKGPCSHTFSNAQITSLRLVFYVIEWASLPYFPYNSVY